MMFVEAWLETGIFGLALMGWFRRVVRATIARDLAWQCSLSRLRQLIGRSLARPRSSFRLSVPTAFFDYPLRTGAMMAVVAFACALLIDPPASAFAARNRVSHREHAAHRTQQLQLPSLFLLWQFQPRRAEGANGPQALPPPARGERWGTDMQWPDEWRDSTETHQTAQAGPANRHD